MIAILSIVVGAAAPLGPAWLVWTARMMTPAPAPVAVVAVLSTQDFESGRQTIGEVPTADLEAFIRDLLARRDYARDVTDGGVSETENYLRPWIERAGDELFQRGYLRDADGNLSRPDGTLVGCLQ